MEQRALLAELSTWDFDCRPPGFEAIDRPDVFAWSWRGSWAGSRGVGRATWSDDEIEGHLPEISSFFARGGYRVRWYVGPSTRSRALPRLLRDRAAAVHEPRLMTAELRSVRFRMNPAVEVRELAPGPLIREIIETAFPHFSVEDRERAIMEKMAYLSGPRRGGELAAFMDGALVGYASWRDGSDGRSVQFVGGWTRPSHRDRGVYSALCAYRCARARRRGRELAVIVADPTTSGPIVAKAGFIDHGPLLIFADVQL